MKRINTENAPAAIGPYSQAVVANGFVFVSGQIPINPRTGQLVDGDISTQTEQVLKNISAILEAAGSSLDKVVRCDVYLTNLEDFAEFNQTYEKFFGAVRPARVTVEVSKLPKGALVEISAIGVVE